VGRILPTHSVGADPAATFREAIERQLAGDAETKKLRIYAYAITDAGWAWLHPKLDAWRASREGRQVEVFVGLDNDASHPAALRAVLRASPRDSYVIGAPSCCFHPKAFLFEGQGGLEVFLGSNNVSRKGMFDNFELGVAFRVNTEDAGHQSLVSWEAAVRRSSEPLTEEIIAVYDEERQHNRTLPRGLRSAGQRRIQAPAATRMLPSPAFAIVEALTETGGEAGRGRQLGLPWAVAHGLFGLQEGGQTFARVIGPDGAEATRKISYFTKRTYREIRSRVVDRG
jgi:HKD family nuclease